MPRIKKRIRKVRLRKLFRVHAALTAVSLGAYFLVALSDPGFLSYDLRQKYHALADDTIAVTATVLGPPAQPVVTAVAACDDDTDALNITLGWADDANAYTYDIDRDSLPLVTGLTVSGYIDFNVSVSTTYQYVVTANGPMSPGSVESLSVSVTTPAWCPVTAATPSVNITSFGGRGVDSYDGTSYVSDRRPVFTGTTNMPNAIIQIIVGAPSTFIAQFTANSNGYWSWKPPSGLSSGVYLFTVTAIDPGDTTRQASASLKFGIKKKDDDARSAQEFSAPIDGMTQPGQPSPVDFSLSVENRDKSVWQGEVLNLSLLVKTLSAQYDAANIPLRFSIVDADGNAVASLTTDELLHTEREIRKQLSVPSYVVAGTYSVRAEMLFDGLNVSRSNTFLVTEVPLISLGGGVFITYADIIRNLGWITLTLCVLLLLGLFIFMREYGVYLSALRHITEQQLKKAGFLTKRKGVMR